ncbi:hypothetical protein FRB99_005547, partial [Tulasnella sp. 403]
MASSSRVFLRSFAQRTPTFTPRPFHPLPTTHQQQIRTFKFSPGEWIRNTIRTRTQIQRKETALQRQEARSEAVQSGQASLFDAAAATDSTPVAPSTSGTPAKVHTQHKYSTASFKISPRKLALLSRQIAHKPIDQAILQMEFSDKRAAGRIKSTLCVARDHAIMKGIPKERMIVSESWVNKVDALARIDIKGRSRMGVKHHRYSKLHVVLKEGETREEILAKKRAKALKKAVSA